MKCFSQCTHFKFIVNTCEKLYLEFQPILNFQVKLLSYFVHCVKNLQHLFLKFWKFNHVFLFSFIFFDVHFNVFGAKKLNVSIIHCSLNSQDYNECALLARILLCWFQHCNTFLAHLECTRLLEFLLFCSSFSSHSFNECFNSFEKYGAFNKILPHHWCYIQHPCCITMKVNPNYLIVAFIVFWVLRFIHSRYNFLYIYILYNVSLTWFQLCNFSNKLK